MHLQYYMYSSKKKSHINGQTWFKRVVQGSTVYVTEEKLFKTMHYR